MMMMMILFCLSASDPQVPGAHGAAEAVPRALPQRQIRAHLAEPLRGLPVDQEVVRRPPYPGEG
jgi:hypothetical protein